MPDIVPGRQSPEEQAKTYVAGLASALGSRDPFAVLRQTPSELRRAVAGLSAGHLTTPEVPGRWSVLQVLRHLADSELVGGFRFRMVLAHDRPALAAYDQDLWADRLHYAEGDGDTALEDFTRLRRGNLRLLERVSPAELRRVGLHAERGEESLEQMLRNHAGHDIVHLRQVERIRQAIGSPSPV